MRIAGVNVPTNKKVYISLTYIYGIGVTTSRHICEATNINPELRSSELSEEQIAVIRNYVTEHCKVEGELRAEVSKNIKALKDLKCYRGLRHIKRLPVHGQRTKTNARTRKGKSAPIAGKKKATK